MTSPSIAETSASNSAFSNQGSGPSTSPEQSINRESVEQGNTSTEKSLNKPLTTNEKVKIIQAAIQKTVSNDLASWGSIDLAMLINWQNDEATNIEDGEKFFRQLLLFVATPSIAPAFHKEVSNGLDIISKFMTFFSGLAGNDFYEEWCDYTFIDGPYFKTSDLEQYAKQYLTGDDLDRVLANEAEKPDTIPRILSTPWYLRSEPEENPLTLTDDELVAALDRYYPGKEWPADKKTIATHEKMKSRLTYNEKERLSILSETPEQKQQRLIDAAVYSELNGPTIPEQISSIGDKVADAIKAPKVLEPDTKIQFRWDKVQPQSLATSTEPSKRKVTSPTTKPGSAVSARTGAITTNKSASSLTRAIRKLAPAKKSSTKKKA